MLRSSIRDLLWLTVVVAILAALFAESYCIPSFEVFGRLAARAFTAHESGSPLELDRGAPRHGFPSAASGRADRRPPLFSIQTAGHHWRHRPNPHLSNTSRKHLLSAASPQIPRQ